MTQLSEIYNQRILELSANIPRAERLADADATATAHSKLCGSTVTVDLKLAGDRVAAYGQTVKACLLGQAAASVMGHNILGSSADELRAVGAAMRKMLKANGPPPDGTLGRSRRAGAGQGLQGEARLHAAGVRRGGDGAGVGRGEAAGIGDRHWGCGGGRSRGPRVRSASVDRVVSHAAKIVAKAPIHAYRWTLKPLIGWSAGTCRPARNMRSKRSSATAPGAGAG